MKDKFFIIGKIESIKVMNDGNRLAKFNRMTDTEAEGYEKNLPINLDVEIPEYIANHQHFKTNHIIGLIGDIYMMNGSFVLKTRRIITYEMIN